MQSKIKKTSNHKNNRYKTRSLAHQKSLADLHFTRRPNMERTSFNPLHQNPAKPCLLQAFPPGAPIKRRRQAHTHLTHTYSALPANAAPFFFFQGLSIRMRVSRSTSRHCGLGFCPSMQALSLWLLQDSCTSHSPDAESMSLPFGLYRCG